MFNKKFINGDKPHYAYDCEGKIWKAGTRTFREQKYGKIYRKGDIIKMEFNVPKRTLLYYKNGVNLGIAFNDIIFENDEKYNMVVSMYEIGDSVQLTHVEQKLAN